MNKPIILFFSSLNCHPCKKTYEALMEIPIINLFTINKIDSCQQEDLVNKYEITSVPTLIFLDLKENEKFRIEKAKNKEFLETVLNSHYDNLIAELNDY